MDPAPKSVISPAARRAVDLRFVELMDKVRRNRPGDDLELLRRAFDFAAEQHKTQTRLSGEPFLSHPVEVAHLLADMRLDVTALCAALLHDVVVGRDLVKSFRPQAPLPRGKKPPGFRRPGPSGCRAVTSVGCP